MQVSEVQPSDMGPESWEALSGTLGDVLDAADVGLWRLHLPTQLATWNAVASRIILGVSEPQQTPVPLPIHPDDRELAHRRIKLLEGDVHEPPVALRVLRPDGEVRWIKASARKPVGAGADAEWIVGLVSDVTEENAAQAIIVEGKRQLATLMDHLPGVAYRCELREPWKMTYVSEGVQLLTGEPPSAFLSGTLTWAQFMHRDDFLEIAEATDRAVREQSSFDVSYRVIDVDGRVHWVQERGRAYYEDGTPRFLEGFIWNISAAKEAEEQARWIANHDSLTQLPNRLLFQETVAHRIQVRKATNFSILLLDLDDFKRTNDTLGHDAGDTLLKEFAARVRTAIRPGDFLARLGGDEFAILLEDVVDPSAIDRAGQAIMDSLGAPFRHQHGLLTCSASIGASIFGQHGRSYSALLKHADVALYAAKAAGRSNLKLFSSHMLNEVQVRSTMLALATSALQSDDIIPYYQPKVDLRTGAIVGFEALMRWRNAAGSLRAPNEIAAAFDDPILAAQVSDRMIEAVVRDMRSWLDAQVPFHHVAINASAAQFQRGDFADRLLAKLEAGGVPPRSLHVEVTETVFLGRGSRYVEHALETLDKAGITIALDDFGTGYASLLHLAQYPVRMLKIDRSFVAKMMSSNHDDAIIQAIISLGHSLGMTVVAEGVEVLSQEARLRAKKCDYAQGFLYAPALPAEQIPAACAEGSQVQSS